MRSLRLLVMGVMLLGALMLGGCSTCDICEGDCIHIPAPDNASEAHDCPHCAGTGGDCEACGGSGKTW